MLARDLGRIRLVRASVGGWRRHHCSSTRYLYTAEQQRTLHPFTRLPMSPLLAYDMHDLAKATAESQKPPLVCAAACRQPAPSFRHARLTFAVIEYSVLASHRPGLRWRWWWLGFESGSKNCIRDKPRPEHPHPLPRPVDPDCRVEPKNMIGSQTPSEALGIIPVSSGDEYDLRHSVFCPLVARTYRQIGKYASPFSELRHNYADRGLDAHRDMGMERLGSRTAYTLHCHIVVPCDGGLEARLVVGEPPSSAHERSGRTNPVDMKPQGKLTTYMVKPGHLQLAASFPSSLSPRRASPGVVGDSVALFACSHRLSAISHMMELGPRKGE